MLKSCVPGWGIFIPVTVMMPFSKLCRALALCFTVFKSILIPPLPKPGLTFHPYLSFLASLLPLSSFLEARYALRAWEFLYTKGPPRLLLSKSPGKPKCCANTCSSPCSGNASLLHCRLHRQPRNPVGKRLHSLARLACGRALCSVTSFSGGVSGGILWLERIVGQV